MLGGVDFESPSLKQSYLKELEEILVFFVRLGKYNPVAFKATTDGRKHLSLGNWSSIYGNFCTTNSFHSNENTNNSK